MKSDGNEIEKTIVEKAKELGASLAGIATVADLKASPSYEIYDKRPFYEEYKGVKWREEHKTPNQAAKLNRLNNIEGQWIKHGDWYPDSKSLCLCSSIIIRPPSIAPQGWE